MACFLFTNLSLFSLLPHVYGSVTPSLSKKAISWSSSLFLSKHYERFVVRERGARVGIWLGGLFGQTDGGYFGLCLPRMLIDLYPEGQCNSQTTLSFVTINQSFGTAVIHASFPISSFRNRNTDSLFSVSRYVLSQKNNSFYSRRHNFFPMIK